METIPNVSAEIETAAGTANALSLDPRIFPRAALSFIPRV
jgi:hypothetical protein